MQGAVVRAFRVFSRRKSCADATRYVAKTIHILIRCELTLWGPVPSRDKSLEKWSSGIDHLMVFGDCLVNFTIALVAASSTFLKLLGRQQTTKCLVSTERLAKLICIAHGHLPVDRVGVFSFSPSAGDSHVCI